MKLSRFFARAGNLADDEPVDMEAETQNQILYGDNDILREPIFQKLHMDAVIPQRVHDSDIGWDLTVRTDAPIRIPPNTFADIPSDLAVQLPEDSWAMLTGRSSALRKHGLLVNLGVIDEGYRGELFAGVFNVSGKQVVVENGWRLAQLIVIGRHDLPAFDALYSNQLSWSSRGTGAFGSTGV